MEIRAPMKADPVSQLGRPRRGGIQAYRVLPCEFPGLPAAAVGPASQSLRAQSGERPAALKETVEYKEVREVGMRRFETHLQTARNFSLGWPGQ